VAFVAVFTVFVVATAVLTVVTTVWVVRYDRRGWQAWRRRAVEGRQTDGPSANGRRPGDRPEREVDPSS
jgi:hypothetical protein